ncbi:hypothetical protein JZ751_005029 [Albula glossodonta]|uniref:DOMON domain-containing protein n=1 Tax=Albula glossodonta TaxID=121402 RepID=A0A8T2PCV4_9TELE|nr:hypothetical protein JZ751_005029 [Albula glossodonta]
MPGRQLYFCTLVFFGTLRYCAMVSLRTGFSHSTVLDAHGKYRLRWRNDEGTITFETEVETKGYIGFGLSPNGAMALSDIVIGGVEKGKPYLQDYFADSSRKVHRDLQQNYRLEYGMENHTHTVLAFSRDLHTCDRSDKDITEDTVRVIWAYHSDDIGTSGPKYHGINRGRKSLRLLNPTITSRIPSETPYFDLKNLNVPVPSKDTTYWCQLFKIPEVSRKHHIIRIEPLIQHGHENLVHHILLYQCDSKLNESELDFGHECYHPNMPDSFLTCETVVFAWAIGGEGLTYPQHVGLSIGVLDSSGLRLFYTPELRQYDAGVIETGVWVSLYHMLPPGLTEYVSEGHCTQECLQESLDHEMPSGVRVFAVLMHSHLAGRAIRTRHFRDGQELQPLAQDEAFDFNFQEFQYLKEERLVLPGGLSTRDEMCLSYLLYYPRINLARCESLPEITGQLKFIGVKEILSPVTTWPFLIKSPRKYSNLTFMEAMDKFKWSKKRGKAFNKMVLQLPVNVRCSKWGQDEWSIQGVILSPPEMKSETSRPLTPCSAAPGLPIRGAVITILCCMLAVSTWIPRCL